MPARTTSIIALAALLAAASASPAAGDWTDMFSRDPHPGMGVGTAHAQPAEPAPAIRADIGSWQQWLGRHPHPAMGVGNIHQR